MTDTDYGLVKIDKGTKTVPMDAPIKDLRWKASGYGYYGYNPSYRGLKKKTIDALDEAQIFLVSDLEGLGAEDLEVFPGIGSSTSENLLKAAKLASVHYRGSGFPWEVNKISVFVPTGYVDYVKSIGSVDARKAIEHFIVNDFFPSIKDTVLRVRKEKLESQQATLDAKLAAVKEELAELEE